MKKLESSELSKFLSLILRHKPEEIQLDLDEYGYAKIEDILNKSLANCIEIKEDDLLKVIETNNKKRFLIKDRKVKATQGHSFPVKLEIPPVKPPEKLYHGTLKSLEQIIKNEGILKMKRSHVHMNSDYSKSYITGSRTSKEPIVFEILSNEMFKDGYKFYHTENDVWLTEIVPSKYIGQKHLNEEFDLKTYEITKKTIFQKIGEVELDNRNYKKSVLSIRTKGCFLCKSENSHLTFERNKIICEEITYDKHKVRHYISGGFKSINLYENENLITVTVKGRIDFEMDSIDGFKKSMENANLTFEGTGLRYYCKRCSNLNVISNISRKNEIFECTTCKNFTLKQIGETEVKINNCQ